MYMGQRLRERERERERERDRERYIYIYRERERDSHPKSHKIVRTNFCHHGLRNSLLETSWLIEMLTNLNSHSTRHTCDLTQSVKLQSLQDWNLNVNFVTASLQGGKKKTPPLRNPLFFEFFGSEASMMYTLLSEPMVYTLFSCFPRKMVYTMASFSLWARGSGERPGKEGCHGGGVYSFPPVWHEWVIQQNCSEKLAPMNNLGPRSHWWPGACERTSWTSSTPRSPCCLGLSHAKRTLESGSFVAKLPYLTLKVHWRRTHKTVFVGDAPELFAWRYVWVESQGCLRKGCLNSTKIPKVGIPKVGIPTVGIPKTGIPKLGIPKVGRFRAPIQTPLRLPLICLNHCVLIEVCIGQLFGHVLEELLRERETYIYEGTLLDRQICSQSMPPRIEHMRGSSLTWRTGTDTHLSRKYDRNKSFSTLTAVIVVLVETNFAIFMNTF